MEQAATPQYIQVSPGGDDMTILAQDFTTGRTEGVILSKCTPYKVVPDASAERGISQSLAEELVHKCLCVWIDSPVEDPVVETPSISSPPKEAAAPVGKKQTAPVVSTAPE